MKKIFWGYDPREVNESVEFLESQNESLNAKIANLNLEILSKNEQLAAKVEGVSNLSNDEKNELTSLRTKTENLNSENVRLQNECRTMLSKIESIEGKLLEQPAASVDGAPAPAENLSQVGDLYQTVFSNISNVKQDVSDSMRKFILDYVSQLEASNKQLREVVSGIEEARAEARSTFIESAEVILEKFNILSDENVAMEEKFKDVDRIKEELYSKINSLAQNMEKKEETPEEKVVVEEVQPKLPPFFAKALSEKKGNPEVRKFYDDNKAVIKTFSGKDSEIASENMASVESKVRVNG